MSAYHRIKSIAKRIIPQRWLVDLEPAIRGGYARLFFHGDTVACPLCDHTFRAFIPLANGGRLCPYCGSLDRNRRLWLLLRNRQLLRGEVLHFSPARCLARLFKDRKEMTYVTSDFESEFPADHRYDLTELPLSDGSVDLLICYHVLEHIPDDRQAMRELYRVCRTGGQVVVQTPFREGTIYEDSQITDPADRLVHFGQADHVRIYSVEGLQERLTDAGFRVEVCTFPASDESAYYGLRSGETVLFAHK